MISAILSGDHQRPLVLVADDYADTRELYAEYLEFAGFDVVTAADGAEALRACGAPRMPDAVVLDVAMPHVDGLELTRRLRSDARTAAIKIVACTGHGSAGEQSAALAAGCDEVLVKPAAPQAVATAVRRHLGLTEPVLPEGRRFSRRR